MTWRTDPHKSAIEQATDDVIADLNSAITHEHKANKLIIPEEQFRRIIALYLFNQKLRDICRLLGIEPQEGDPT